MRPVPLAFATSIAARPSRKDAVVGQQHLAGGGRQVPVGELIVRGAVQVDIDDRADIGWYDADRVDFDGAASRSCQPELTTQS